MSDKEHFDCRMPDFYRTEQVFDHSFCFWTTTEYFLLLFGLFQRPFNIGQEAKGNLNTLRGSLIPTYTDYHPWSEFTEEQKDSLDFEMTVYAAIIDRMDQNNDRFIGVKKKNYKDYFLIHCQTLSKFRCWPGCLELQSREKTFQRHLFQLEI